jgi:hypothetical protein
LHTGYEWQSGHASNERRLHTVDEWQSGDVISFHSITRLQSISSM